MEKNSKIYIAGHRGLVGSSIIRKLKSEGYENLIFCDSTELDLRRQSDVEAFFQTEKPEYVYLGAAKVGGILANTTYPAQFIYDNLMIACNVIHCSYLNGVKKLLFLGSSCIYPRMATQPIVEEELLSGYLEKTNEAYALSKISGLKMCEYYNTQYKTDFISIMPTNLYGQNDNYDLESSHVLPALIRKFHEAKVQNLPFTTIWGSGSPKREFLHVDDIAAACFFLMQNYSESDTINVGTGTDVSIKELALLIKDIVGYTGELRFDLSKPDGTPRKLLDVSKINKLGWSAKIDLATGIEMTYKDFLKTASALS